MVLAVKYLLVFTTFLSFFTAVYTWRKRPMLGAVPFSYLMMALAIWLLASSQVIENSSLEYKVVWTRLSYLGIVIVPGSAFYLSLQYTRHRKWIKSPLRYLLAIEPLLVTILVWTNQYHHFFWKNIGVHQGDYFQSLQFENGPGFWIHVIYSQILIFLSFALLMNTVKSSSEFYKRQAVSLLMGASLPWLVRLIYIFFLAQIPTIDPTPLFFSISSLLVALGLFRFKIFDIVPIAYDSIIESMGDGLIVLDSENRVVEANPAAEDILHFKEIEIIGLSVHEAFASFPTLLEKLNTNADSNSDLSFHHLSNFRFYNLRIVPLFGRKQQRLGRMILIQDFTEQKKKEDTQKRRIDELAALHSALIDITASRDIYSLMTKITEGAVEMVQALGASLYRLDKKRGVMECTVNYHNPIDQKGMVVALGQDIAGIVGQTGEKLVVRDYSNWELRSPTKHKTGPVAAIGVPLLSKNDEDINGVLVVVYAKLENPYIDTDVELLSMLAHQSVIVIEKARLLLSERRQREKADTLQEISRAINSSLDIKCVLDMLLEQLARVVSYDSASLMLVEDDYFTIVSEQGFRPEQKSVSQIKTTEILHAKQVLDRQSPIILADTQSDQRWQNIPGSSYIRCWLGVPLVYQGKSIGLLNLDKEEPYFYSEADANLAAAFANQAVIAIENARLFEAADRRAREAETLRQATSVVAATLKQEESIERILDQLDRVVSYDSASVQLLQDGCLEIVGGRGWPNPKAVVGTKFPINNENPNSLVINSRQPVIVSDTIDSYPVFKDNLHNHIRSWLGVPLIVHDRIIGMFAVDSQTPGTYNNDHARLVAAFADQVAIAIENARLYAEAERRANELRQLYDAAQDLTQSLEPEVVLSKLAKHLTDALSATSGYIIDVDLENEELTVVAEYWSEEACEQERGSELYRVYPLSAHTSVMEAYHRGEPVCYTPNSPDRTEAEREELLAYGVKSSLLVPIILRGDLVGQVQIWESRYERDFTTSENRLAMALAQHAAAVLENAHLYSAERMRVAELDALRDTMADLSSELELPKLLQAILERSVEMLKGSGGEVGLFDAGHGQLEIVACYQMNKDNTGLQMALGEGVMGRVAQSCEPLIVPNYPEWDGKSHQYEDNNWSTVVAAPLMIGGRLLGVLGVVDADRGRIFSTSEQHLMNLFAQQAAIAVENARLYTEAREAADRRAILHHASQEVVAASLDPEGVYITLHNAASKLMPTEAFAITLLDENRNMIDAVYIYDHQGRARPISFPVDRGLSGAVIASGKSLYIRDLPVDGNTVDSIRVGDKEDVRSIIAVPMRLGGKVIGMLSAQSYQPQAYTDDDMALLEMLASYAAIALDNARLFAEVQKLAITDSVTGIFNRRQLFELGQREFSRSLRFGRPLAAILFDIDEFKIVNDTCGHPAGDVVLRVLAQIVQDMIREIDVLGRYGGEEFVVVLPETTSMAAEWVSDRIRKKVANTPIPTDKGEVNITISIGVTEITPDIPDFAALVARADEAMYDAKQAGKNGVAIR
ncbi:MAG: GAF domain-containing protein [Chloroflexi bacterium]|nr:MAG: GAF domain-containing protein [Chloroflexota bacterium]